MTARVYAPRHARPAQTVALRLARAGGQTSPGALRDVQLRLLSLALVLAFGLACAKAPPSSPASARHGESSFRVLAEAEVVNGAPEPSPETITAIHPFAENQAPSYPDAALGAGCGDGLVPVRVHVGIDGRVSEIRRIPGRVVAGDACYGNSRRRFGRLLAPGSSYRPIGSADLRPKPQATRRAPRGNHWVWIWTTSSCSPSWTARAPFARSSSAAAQQ